MIKRTLYFGNPAYLSVRLGQLEIRLPQVVLQEQILRTSLTKQQFLQLETEDLQLLWKILLRVSTKF